MGFWERKEERGKLGIFGRKEVLGEKGCGEGDWRWDWDGMGDRGFGRFGNENKGFWKFGGFWRIWGVDGRRMLFGIVHCIGWEVFVKENFERSFLFWLCSKIRYKFK